MENLENNESSSFIEKHQYGMQAFILVFGSCVASIAAMCVLKYSESVFLLSTVAVLAMATNALCIGQAPIKTCFKVFYVSVIVNVLIILFELIAA